MQPYIRKFNTMIRLSWLQKAWLPPLYILSGFIRLAILTLPFRWIAPFMGYNHGNARMSVMTSPEQGKRARQLGTTIKIISRYTPWETKCLVQALLAKKVLEVYKIPHAIFFGLSKSEIESETLKAHAWVNAGRCFVTGGNNHKNFTVVSCFVSEQAICQPNTDQTEHAH